MAVTVLKDVMIEANTLDRYFEGRVPVDLWRAYNGARGQSPFDFVQVPFVLSNGRPRPADITIGEVNGAKWVYVRERPRGLSLFDKEGLPPGKDWRYLKIPQGTQLPEGLTLVRDELNTRWDATHYTLAPAHDMLLSRFVELLGVLARELAQSPASGAAP